jgi:hypothetical protein
MKLSRKGSRTITSIEEAACGQFITTAAQCSGPTEASEHTSQAVAQGLARLIHILHGRKRITDADVLELLVDYEEAE